MQYKPFASQFKTRNRCSLPIVWHCASGGGNVFMVRVCHSLSYLFQCGYFLSYLVCRSHSASFWSSFRGSAPRCSCTYSVSVGKRASGAFCIAILLNHCGTTKRTLLSYFDTHLSKTIRRNYQKYTHIHTYTHACTHIWQPNKKVLLDHQPF